ncbi:MAG: hypothetical protein ABIP95_12005 [Pelobium sp.]
MTLKTKLTTIKTIGIIVFVPFVFSFLFYVGLIIPEYCACDRQMYEGQRGTTIWGDTVDCGIENMDFSEAFFQLFTIINLGFITALVGLFLWYRNLRKKKIMGNTVNS